METKLCTTCGQTKPTTEFNRSARDGHQPKCRPCKRQYNLDNHARIRARQKEYNVGWRRKRGIPPRQPASVVPGRLRRRNLTVGEYEAMLEACGGLCAICRMPDDRGIVIDHDHNTGEVRGLLCNRCNTGIGLLRDNPTILLSAIAYLRATSQTMDDRSAGYSAVVS